VFSLFFGGVFFISSTQPQPFEGGSGVGWKMNEFQVVKNEKADEHE
jgi:hypothetical protein